MFQLRAEPRYFKIQKLINEDLGRMVRVNWINTDWNRPEDYYGSGGWRATWKGEGGGVLLNRCHALFILARENGGIADGWFRVEKGIKPAD